MCETVGRETTVKDLADMRQVSRDRFELDFGHCVPFLQIAKASETWRRAGKQRQFWHVLPVAAEMIRIH